MKTTKALSLLLSSSFCLCFGIQQASAANLVTNGGFETGDFTGWTLSGNDVPGALDNLYGVEGTDPINSIAPHGGSYQAYFGDLLSNATTLSQTLSTVTGGYYFLTFYLAQDTAPTTSYPNGFTVSFAGSTAGSMSQVGVEGYTKYTFVGNAVSPTSTFSITLGNGLGEFLLDDVSVTQSPVPEPSAAILVLAGGAAAFLARRKPALKA